MNMLYLILLSATLSLVHSETLLEILEQRSELSQFREKVISDSSYVKSLLTDKSVTLFAPNNQALDKHGGGDNDLRYYLCNEYLLLEKLKSKDKIQSFMAGHLPMWILVHNNSVFINDAKIIASDIKAQTTHQERQVLHIIDSVLEPVAPTVGVRNPDALELLKAPNNYIGFGSFDLSGFNKAVHDVKVEDLFSSSEDNTYFLPETKDGDYNGIDEEVIRGHIIPRQVLFLRNLKTGLEYPTTNNGTVQTMITRQNRTQLGEGDLRIESFTLKGDEKHVEGVVSAHIVHPNVPVRNGVVHFISRPLVLVNNHINQILQTDPRLSIFANLTITQQNTYKDNITLLAPSNEAFKRLGKELEQLRSDEKKLQKILGWHIINERCLARYPAIYSETCDKFEWRERRGVETLVVEGGGVVAGVVDANIAAKNGIIHVIDKLLGVPYKTLLHTLHDNDNLRYTYMFANANLEQLMADMANNNKSFTVLAPTNDAWGNDTFEKSHVKKHGKSELIIKVFKRHIIVGKELTMEDMVAKSEEGVLETISGKINVNRKPDEQGYVISWNGVTADVLKFDIDCTNGKLHILGNVFVTEDELLEKVTKPNVLSTTVAKVTSNAVITAVITKLLLILPFVIVL